MVASGGRHPFLGKYKVQLLHVHKIDVIGCIVLGWVH